MSTKLQKLEADIQAQRQKLDQLKAQKQQIEARERAKLRSTERRHDTRRKVLAGAMVLEMMEQDPEVKHKVLLRLDAFLVRPDDRALFGLATKTSSSAPG